MAEQHHLDPTLVEQIGELRSERDALWLALRAEPDPDRSMVLLGRLSAVRRDLEALLGGRLPGRPEPIGPVDDPPTVRTIRVASPARAARTARPRPLSASARSAPVSVSAVPAVPAASGARSAGVGAAVGATVGAASAGVGLALAGTGPSRPSRLPAWDPPVSGRVDAPVSARVGTIVPDGGGSPAVATPSPGRADPADPPSSPESLFAPSARNGSNGNTGTITGRAADGPAPAEPDLEAPAGAEPGPVDGGVAVESAPEGPGVTVGSDDPPVGKVLGLLSGVNRDEPAEPAPTSELAPVARYRATPEGGGPSWWAVVALGLIALVLVAVFVLLPGRDEIPTEPATTTAVTASAG
ncbi:MAG: hypothetical protein ACK5PP_00405 [Acidimicrobiales bacterium]